MLEKGLDVSDDGLNADPLLYRDGECHPSDPNGWPIWPIATAAARRLLAEAHGSGRWSISGVSTGSQPMERRFAAAFAQYINTSYCVPVSNGSSALVAALAALDIGVGDEVIVPGLTWVAPAVAVLAVNAIPIIVDVDADSLCIAPAAIEAAINSQTRAIIVVHLYASTADMNAIIDIAQRYGLRIVEDCAQSHGTVYDGRKVGSLGDIGVFSMHQSKTLTSGEGGAACTNDPSLFARIEQMRANGRRHRDPPAPRGDFDLVEVGELLGTNMALSEFQAALLIDGLDRLDEQVERRAAAMTMLDKLLGEVNGVRPVARPLCVDQQSVYHYPVRFDPEIFGGASPEKLGAFLSHALGILWSPTYPPLDRHPLWRSRDERRFSLNSGYRKKLTASLGDLPNSKLIHNTTVIVNHRALLAEGTKLAAIPKAFRAARDHLGTKSLY